MSSTWSLTQLALGWTKILKYDFYNVQASNQDVFVLEEELCGHICEIQKASCYTVSQGVPDLELQKCQIIAIYYALAKSRLSQDFAP